ncbi:PREDICTED: histone H1 [Tarenaya hassleriana]|uniref:histone H1 n=1 Tax=Tarenaya hassleriana TaxID=28532 RepID=UPI00053C0A57|nr:PREDICTED: histone H1 [Tarenaya hassleriana]
MADKEEIESQQPPDPAREEKPETAEVEEKEEEKEKATKEKKPRKPKTATHPPYFQMIKEALLALNEKSGSSPYAIAKFIEGKHRSVLPENFRKTLALKLKNSASKGKIVKIRASYKLSSESTKKTRSATAMTTRQKAKKKQEETKTTRKRARSTSTRAKTMSLNKPEVATKKKRSGTRKAKPRQPKSIKSPSGKKAMKASAST